MSKIGDKGNTKSQKKKEMDSFLHQENG